MSLPLSPDPHAIAVMLLTLFALLLFTRERIPLETSSLLVLVLLVAGFELLPYHAADGTEIEALSLLAGFSHEALVAVVALLICGQGLVRTGALEPVGRSLARLWVKAPVLSLLLTLTCAALLSAFVNNTPIVVLLLPILISVALRTRTPPSSTLLPMGLATLIGGMTTSIGTSTNLLVVSVAADLGVRRMQMFDFVVPAAIAAGVGLVYLWLIAPRMLPARTPHMVDTSPRVFSARLRIPADSTADGMTLAEVRDLVDDLRVSQIRRGELTLMPLPDIRLRADDQLVVSDTPERLKGFEEGLGIELFAGDHPVDEEHPLAAADQQIAEVVVTPGTRLLGSTLARLRFDEHHGLRTLAIHRPGGRLPGGSILDVVLRVGDVLLVQGSRDSVRAVKLAGEMMVLDATVDLPHSEKAPVALLIMAAVVLSAATGVMAIAASAMVGVLLMLVSGCLRWREATRAISTSVVLIVVASLALGAALVGTGATDYLAGMFLWATDGMAPAAILSGLMLLLALLTNIVSNNAAAVIGTPIAISIAAGLNAPPEPFVLAVLFGANMSFATPMAYKTNLLVFSAGGYTFGDFLRVGLPLTVLMWITFSFLLPLIYL